MGNCEFLICNKEVKQRKDRNVEKERWVRKVDICVQLELRAHLKVKADCNEDSEKE